MLPCYKLVFTASSNYLGAVQLGVPRRVGGNFMSYEKGGVALRIFRPFTRRVSS